MISAKKLVFQFSLLAIILTAQVSIFAQKGFAEQVDRALGSNQELVNGIQFSNQYIRSEGQPYWLDGGFRTASVFINDHWYEGVRVRYNLYSQKLEMEYLTPEGHMNQIMTVPENISAFFLGGYLFRRLKIADETPSYYQYLLSGNARIYIRWKKDLRGSASTSSRFDLIQREYWIECDEKWLNFKDRKSYLAAFPAEHKAAFKKLLKQQAFSFKHASTGEMVEMLQASIQLYEEGGQP